MKVFFINRDSSNMNINMEGIYFYYFYLFAEEAEFNSMLPFFVGNLEDKDNWSLRWITDMFYKIAAPSDPLVTHEDVLSSIKTMNEIKKHKHKSREEIIFLQQMQGFFNKYKSYLITWHEELFKIINVQNWMDLLEEDVLNFTGCSRYDAKNPSEDELVPLINDFIISKERFFWFDSTIGKYMNEMQLEDQKTESRAEANAEFYSFPLFSIPYGKHLSIENVRVLRRSLHDNIGIISGKINEFKSSSHHEDFGDGMKKKALSFFETLMPETETFQKHIDGQMYFQQVINSDSSTFKAQLRVGVCSVRTLAQYFGKSKILLPFVAEALEKKLALHTDLNKCDVFLYLSGAEQINKPVS